MNMSKNITDIAYWKEDYPFLNNMVTAYEEFNSAVIDEDDSTIASVMSVLESWRWDVENHKEIYKKLTRNLLLLLLNKKYIKMSNKDYCRYLYQWVYHTKKKYDINEFNISLFYQAIHDSIIGAGAKIYCPYYSYDNDYENSINIIKLQNFHHNVNTIRDILIKKSDPKERNSQYCYAQRYANECVKIYRNMHDEFCSGDIKHKIPDLSSSENEKHFGCPSNEPAAPPELIKESVRAPKMLSESGSGHESISDSSEQSGSTMPFNATAVVGTMIGIPPFLGLIYRFTPVGTMFRAKNNKGTNVFNNLDEEIEKELYYPRHETAAINSNHARYNVAYGPV